MDQLKDILKQVQKHHFWLLCVLAMIGGMVGWFMARKSLSAAYTQNKGTIVGKFSALQAIVSSERPPNGTWTEAISKLTAKEKDLVRKAWEKVYNEQKKHLEWSPDLGKPFLDFVNGHPPDAKIPDDLCDIYQDKIIKSEFPRLLAIVEAQPHNAAKTLPDNTKKGSAPAVDEPKVVWETASQEEVEKLLEFPKRPTSAQVRQAQEDIWVYQALLTIIRAMNQDTYVGRVRRISELSIGHKGAVDFQAGMTGTHIEHLKAPAAAAAGGPAAAAAATPAAEGEDAGAKPIDEGRYLNAEGKPAAAGFAATQQYKQMPIFMRLTIDQREINKLLVECANSPLPVEVSQLRINSSKNSGSKSSSASTPSHGGAASSGPSDGESYEVPIDVAGIIYIYNPPDTAKLGSGQPAAAGQPAAGAGGAQ
jgi:hypothetical protein